MSLFPNKYLNYNASKIEDFCTIPVVGTNFVPQGVCQFHDKIALTCYDSNKIENTILIVCSKTSYKILSLDDRMHGGSVCYHEESDSLYVTGRGIGVKSFIHRYCGKNILDAEDHSMITATNIYCVDESNDLYSSSAKHSSPGFMTCYKNYLFVGNFSDYAHAHKNNGILKKYRIAKDGSITSKSEIIYNPYSNTQGLCIYEKDNKEYYVFSRSFGRKRNSILNIATYDNHHFENIATNVLPCMSEQVSQYNNDIVIIFESCADCYSKKCIGIRSEVAILSFDELLKGQDSFKIFCKGDKLFIDNKKIKMSF